MKRYEMFLDEVMPFVPGCSNELAIYHIKNAVIEFCEKSLVLQRDLDPVTVIEGTSDYDLEPPTGYAVTKIMKAFYKRNLLMAAAPDMVNLVSAYNPMAPDAEGNSIPNQYFQKDEVTVTLVPVPSETVPVSLTIRAALKPLRSSQQIEDAIFEDYAETIGNGAKYRLLSIPSKPYTDPVMAKVCMDMFEAGLNVAKQRAERGYVRSNLMVRQVQI